MEERRKKYLHIEGSKVSVFSTQSARSRETVKQLRSRCNSRNCWEDWCILGTSKRASADGDATRVLHASNMSTPPPTPPPSQIANAALKVKIIKSIVLLDGGDGGDPSERGG